MQNLSTKIASKFLVNEYLLDKLLFFFQVGHLLPENKFPNSSDDYVLLHPGTAKYIWFPDIYIGQSGQNIKIV